MKTNIHFWRVFLRIKSVSDKSCKGFWQKHFMFNNYFLKKNLPLWFKIIVKPKWPQVTMRYMRIACWITEVIKAHSGYVIFFNALFVARKYNNILTFIILELETGTNFPAVSVNPLLAVVMMKTRQRWNVREVPTQSEPHA
jgi:hypothetical protein